MFLVFVIFTTSNWVEIGAALAIAILLGGIIYEGAFNHSGVAISLYSAGKLAKSDLISYIILEILGGLAAFYVYDKYVKKA